MSAHSYLPEDHPWEFYPPTPIPVDSCPPIYYEPSDSKQKPRPNYLSIVVLVLLIVCLLAFVAAIGGIIGRYFLTGAVESDNAINSGTTECPCDLSKAGWIGPGSPSGKEKENQKEEHASGRKEGIRDPDTQGENRQSGNYWQSETPAPNPNHEHGNTQSQVKPGTSTGTRPTGSADSRGRETLSTVQITRPSQNQRPENSNDQTRQPSRPKPEFGEQTSNEKGPNDNVHPNVRPTQPNAGSTDDGWIRYGSTDSKQPQPEPETTGRPRSRPDFIFPPPVKTTTAPRTSVQRPVTTPSPTTPMTTTTTTGTTVRPPPRPTPPPLTPEDRQRIEESIRRSQQKDQSKSTEATTEFEPLTTMNPLATTTEPSEPGQTRDDRDSKRINALLYRIPRQKMNPLHYDVTMQVHAEDQIEGIVSIGLQIGEDTKTIGLHAADIHIQGVSVTDSAYATLSSKAGKNEKFEDMYGSKGSWGVDPLHETLTIRTTSTLRAGKTYNVTIRYDISVRNNLAINIDSTNNVLTWATKLEPTYARFLIPCLDDPALKASFTTTIIHRIADNNTVLANEDLCKRKSENGWYIDEFCKTPLMTTYNFAIVYGNLISLCDFASTRVRVCVWLKPEYRESLQYALHTAIETFDRAQHYFHVPYKMSKMDIVGVADYPSAAMENWGLIVHHVRTLALEVTTRKEMIEDIITHEVVHQWFGNLISLSWWDDIWINEGFAQFYTTYFRQHDRPVEAQNTYFNYFLHTMRAQGIPGLDGALVRNYSNPYALSESFVHLGFLNIYSKGAYMVSMLHELTEKGRFRNAIVQLLQQYAFKSINRYELLEVFQPYVRVHKKMTEVMVPWLENPGYPEVHIWRNITSGEMILYQYPANQHRHNDFSGKIDKSIDEELFWPIPVTYQTKWGKDKDTNHIYWLTEAMQDFVIPNFGVTEWVVLNPGFKYMYRVNYDELTLELLMAQLREDHRIILPESRVEIMFDSLYFFLYSDTRFIQLLDLLGYMERETEVLPLLTGIDALSEIFIAFKDSSLFPLLQIQFSPAIFQIFEVYKTVRDDPQHEDVVMRHGTHVCRLICAIGHPHCEGFAKHENLTILSENLGRITGERVCEYMYFNRRVLHYTSDDEFKQLLKAMRSPFYFEYSLNPTAFYVCILCAPNRYFVAEALQILHDVGELSAVINYALNYHHLTFEPCPYMYSELWKLLAKVGTEDYIETFSDTKYRFTQGVGLANTLRKLDQVSTARKILPKSLTTILDFAQGRIEWIERNENKLARDLHKRLKTPHWKSIRRSFG